MSRIPKTGGLVQRLSKSELCTLTVQRRLEMAEGRDATQEALIENFTTITGASSERARFYLEAAGWDFPVRHVDIILLKNNYISH